MSREFANAVAGDTPGRRLNGLLERQLDESRRAGGQIDLDALLGAVSFHYDCLDAERRGIARSMQILSDEARALTREIRAENASHLQSILDNAKDAIITVDVDGRVETCNRTGERLFGHSQAQILGRTLDLIMPALDPRGARDFLERVATKVDDQHLDLTAYPVMAMTRNGDWVAVEIAVSKANLNQREGYIVCVRDITERQLAEQLMRESEARYRTLVEHAPEVIVVFDVDVGRFVDVNDRACHFFKMDRDTLLASGPERISPPLQPDGSPSFGVPRGYIDGALAGDSPVFEWVHCDSTARSLPCEVRFVRLPSFNRRLIRASITDITERKRAEAIAAGERRVFEKIAANAPLGGVLQSIAEVIERVIEGARCALGMLEPDAGIEPSCETRGDAASAAGPGGATDPRPTWSTPILASDGRVVGSFAIHCGAPAPLDPRDHELLVRMAQIAGIAIERRAAEDALRRSEAKFRGLFNNVMEGVYQSALDGRLLAINPAFVELLGYDSAEELYATSADALYWYPSDRANFIRRMEGGGEMRNDEWVMRRKDGSMLVVLENSRVVRDKHGRMVGFEGTIVDITERKKAETAVFQAKERAQVTLQSIGDAVITTDSEGLIDYMNPVAESLTGWESRAAQSRHIDEVLIVVDEGTGEPAECPATRCLREGRVLGLAEHTVLVNRGEKEISIQDSAAPIRDRANNLIGAVMVFHDISKERRLHRALHYQASHDALTGLINRREFENRLTAAVEDVRADGNVRHSLLYLDLDQFKLVNDTCGHPAGDQLLKQITGLLQSRIRNADTLARLGGDEFGILLQNCALDQAERLAQTLRQAIRDYRFIWHEGVLGVGVSIGIVEITGDTPTVANVMSAADVACYSAKDAGRDRVEVYQPDHVPERHREMHWVSKLTRACVDGNFELFYQPIVPIGTTPTSHEHFELMLRLREDSGALIAPAQFIPAAERYNVMPAIDRWVIKHALERIVHRSGSGASPYTVAINLSGNSLNDERFLEFLIAELSAVETGADALCFEITETAAIANLGNVVHFMRELKGRGCQFALDDFGSGLSSFMYLRTLPVDYLKIEGQFIENVARDAIDRSMVEAISQVGRAMGIQTIAERVESQEVLAALADLGIGYAQGYHIAMPRPIADFPHRSRASRIS